MKIQHSAWLVIIFTAGIAGTALSADGDAFKEGQTAYAKRASIACNSKDELQQARSIAKQGNKGAFFAYLNGHCGTFDKPEKVKILDIESGNGDQIVIVKDLDDPSAPAQLWMDSKSLVQSR